MDAKQKAIKLFKKNRGLLRRAAAIRLGIHPSTLYQLKDEGALERLKKGIYKLIEVPDLPEERRNIPYSKYFIAVQKKEKFDIEKLNIFTPLLPPQKKMYADPMLFSHQGIDYIFFEDYDYHKGVISYVTVDKDLLFSPPQTALKLPVHLSFPHIFEVESKIYMTPETYDLQEVGLYQAMNFPHEWVRVRTLVKGEPFADPILFYFNGYFWLFTSTSDYRLRVYFARTLQNQFVPHPINRTNISGRNAGRIYYFEGRCLRPVMDCSLGYGCAMSLREIKVLTPSCFEEQEVYHIDPTWADGLDGTHTLNCNENLVVYDGRRTIHAADDEKYSQK